VEQELTAGLSEGQVAKLVEDDEVHARQMVGEPALPAITGFGLKPINEVDHVVEAAASAGTDTASGNGKVRLTGAGPSDQHGIALLGDETAAATARVDMD
jgi:hypothetical protein